MKGIVQSNAGLTLATRPGAMTGPGDSLTAGCSGRCRTLRPPAAGGYAAIKPTLAGVNHTNEVATHHLAWPKP